MTVKEFLVAHPDVCVNMLTPRGYVFMTPNHTRDVLEGETVYAHRKRWNDCVVINAAYLLALHICILEQEKADAYMFHMEAKET